MKSAFIILFILLTVMNIITWHMLPDRVASHFGKDGQPDGWLSKNSHFFLMQGLYVFMFLMFYFSPVLIFKVPPQSVNLPNRDFWLSPENREQTRQKISNAMYEMGVYIFLFFGFIGYLAFQANQDPPFCLNESIFIIGLCGFFALTIYWIIKFMLSFKKPN